MIRRIIDRIQGNKILTLITLGYLLLASTGLFYNFGLATVVGDEAPSMSAALKMIAEQTLRPAYPTLYYLPVNVYLVLPFVLLGVGTLPLFGVPLDMGSMQEFVILDFAKLLPWVRLASVCYGALSVLLLYQIAMRVFRRREIALLAAFLFSTSLLFLQLVHFGRVWSAQILMILLSLWATLRMYDEPSLRRYIFSALSIGLAFGINVIGGLVYVPFAIAHILLNRGRSMWKTLFMHRAFLSAHATLLALIGLLYYLNPYGLENYVRIVRRFFSTVDTAPGIEKALSGELSRFCGDGIVSGLTYYPSILGEYDLPILFLFLIGAAAFLIKWKRPRPEVGILCSFGVTYLVGITAISAFGVNTCEPRYALPLIPLLAMAAASTGILLIDKIGKRYAGAVLAVVVVASLYGPVLFDLRMALPSTRLMARDWIFENIPSGSRIVTFEEPISLPENTQTLRDIETHVPYFMTKKRAYLLAAPESATVSSPVYYVLTPNYFRNGIPTELLSAPYDYVVISWWTPNERYLRLKELEQLGFTGKLELSRRFPDNATEETESIDLPNNIRAPLFRLHRLQQNGPTIEVYQLR